jgi:c(7)-type cytochrome triheme protein
VGRIYLKWVIVVLIITGVSFVGGCTVDRLIDSLSLVKPESTKPLTLREEEDLYEKFHNKVIHSGRVRSVNGGGPKAFLSLPRDAYGAVNWTTAVMEGFLAPKGSLDPKAKEEEPLNLNIFIEAKVPLMANVVFPHSIHTYWLSCNTCHPNIFIPEAGANPITMDEIFEGKWCGRCHGKVAFNFWPEANCRRCHMVPKKMSGRKENF